MRKKSIVMQFVTSLVKRLERVQEFMFMSILRFLGALLS